MKKICSLFLLLTAMLCLPLTLRAEQLNEGFEDATFAPDGWKSIHVSGSKSWERNSSYHHEGAACAYVNYASSPGHENYLVTPKLLPADGESLSFYVASQSYSGTTLTIEVSTTTAEAASFATTLATYTTGSSGTIGTTSASTWVEKVIDLSAYAGQEIYVAFHVVDNDGSSLYLDDVTGVSIKEEACPRPKNLALDGDADPTEALIVWDPVAGAESYDLEYSTSEDFTDPQAPSAIEGEAGLLEDLTPGTTYYVRVRAFCGGEDYSEWSSTFSFKTKCVAVSVASGWSENFDEREAGDLDITCWENEHIAGSSTSVFKVETTALGGNSTKYVQLPDMSSGNKTLLSLPVMTFPDGYEFVIDVYRKYYSTMKNNEGLRIYVSPTSQLADTVLLGFIPRERQVANTADGIAAEAADGWYTYNFTLPISGEGRIFILGVSEYGASTNFDNLVVRELPACLKPSGLAFVSSETNSAILNWEAGESGEIAWDIYYSTENVAPTAETVPSIEGTSDKEIQSGLNPSSTYYVWVRAHCNDDDRSDWIGGISFQTKCEAVSALSENFDSYDIASAYTPTAQVLPVCWSAINTSTSSDYKWYPTMYYNSYTDYSHSPNNSLRFYSYYSSWSSSYDPQPQYAIMPVMNFETNKRIVFWARGYNESSTIKIGRMTNPEDASTFVQIGEEIALTTSYQKFTINLTGEGNYIAIMIDAATSSRTYNGAYIDDIVVEDVPSCLEPSGLAFASATTTSATFTWTAGDSEIAWDIYYSTENVAPTAETIPSIEGTSDKEIQSGLNPSSTYYIWVRAHCGDSDQSPWVGGISFQTECDAVSALNENFNGYTGSTSASVPAGYPDDQLPTCWQFLNRATTTSIYPQVFISSNSGYAVSGNCLFFKSSSTTPLYAILPEFAENISALQLTFTYRNEGTGSSNGTLYVGYLTDPADASTFVSVHTCEQTTTLTEQEVLFADAPAGSYIAFKYEGGSSNNYYLSIDDVVVGPIPTCQKPADPKCDAKTAHTATLSWTNGAEGQNAWQIVVDTITAFNPDTVNAARIIDVASNPATIDGLLSSKTYYAYVRANCGEDGFSAWSKKKVTFTTIAGNIAPSGLAVDGASLASDAATVTWVSAKNDLHASFDLFYSKINELPETPEGDSLFINITDTFKVLSGLDAETTYYVWVRDNCGADGYSAWVSFSFTTLANCPVPGELSASEIAAHSAKIAWNVGTNDSYNVRYRTAALDNAFLEQGFEDGMGGWTTSNPASSTGISSSTNGIHSGASGFTFSWAYSNQYLISSEIAGLDADASLEFYYNNESSTYEETFKVGFSSTDKTTSSFAFGDEVTASDQQWHKYSATVPAGTKYICIMCTSYDKYYLYIDDIVLFGAPTPAGEWQDGGNSLVKELTISGLEPETKYEAKVQGVCGTNPTEWSEESVFFTTIPSCMAPVVAEPVILPDGATFSWTAGGAENQFEYACVAKDAEVEAWTLLDANIFTVTISGKASGVNYDFYVRAYCGEEDRSAFVKKSFAAFCKAPTAPQVEDITTTTATLSWTAAADEAITKYQYVVLPAGSAADWKKAVLVENVTSVALDELTASSSYVVYIRSYYNEFSQSAAISTIFATECEAVSAASGWKEDFNGYTGSTSASVPAGYPDDQLPTCWQFLNRATTTSIYPQVFISSNSGYAVSGNCLFFKSSSTTPLYAILPEFAENISALQLTFTYRNEGTGSSNGTLYVGYLTDPADASTFVSVHTCEQTTTLTEQEVLFADAPAGSYIAFKYEGGSSNNYYLSIDDVVVGPIPTCQKPADPKCDAKTAHTATLSWTNGAEGQNAWQIVVDTITAFNPDTVNAARIIDVASNPVIIDGLLANKTYYAYVRAKCGEESVSYWSANKATFTTIAGNIAPSGLAVDNASLASDAAIVTWVSAENELHENFELFYSKINELPEAPEGDSLISNIAEAEYAFASLEAETTYYVWVRDNCGADGNSAWTSSISFTTLANCPVPGELSVSEIAAHSAKIAWNVGANDSYNVRYRTAALDNVLLEQGFEDGIGGWTTSNAQSSTGINSSAAHTGSNGFRFSYTTLPPQYLISPEIAGIDADATLEFYYKNYSSSYAESFEVGFSSTDNATSSFAFEAEVTADDQQWHQYSVTVPEGTKYISIKCTSDNAYYLYIDDIVLLGAATPAGEWQDGGNSLVKELTIEGLTAETKYEAQAQGVCGVDPTEWSESVFFTTTPSCMAPSALEVNNITANSAILSWTNGAEGQNAWQICLNGDEENLIDVTENPYTLALAPATAYSVKVRANCDLEDKSAWSDAIEFVTKCEAIVVDADNAFNEGFENTDFAPACWENIASGSYKWSRSTSYHHGEGSASASSAYYGDIYLVMPELAIAESDDKDVQLSFWSYNTYPSDYDKNSVVLLGESEQELWSPASVSTEWVSDTIDLSAFKGQTIQLAFKYEGSNAHGWYLDDVKVEFVEKPHDPTGLSGAGIENVAIKRIENDQVVIIRNGEKFTIMGVKIQ